MTTINEMSRLLRRAKLRLLQMHYESKIGHLGGNLSCLDLIMCLHHQIMGCDDVFVLSKGHSVGALYVTLWSLGRISDSELKSFHKDNTRLAGHPSGSSLEFIPFSTGSLGHGLPMATGLALSKRIRKTSGKIYCLVSDGELNEGSTWESLMFLSHHNLELVVIVDKNNLQGFGLTSKVLNLDPLIEKFQSFGIHGLEIDGHDLVQIESVISDIPKGPCVVIANTIKGNGVHSLENRMESHYLPLSEDQYNQALKEIESK